MKELFIVLVRMAAVLLLAFSAILVIAPVGCDILVLLNVLTGRYQGRPDWGEIGGFSLFLVVLGLVLGWLAWYLLNWKEQPLTRRRAAGEDSDT